MSLLISTINPTRCTNLMQGYTTTATAGGVTTLTAASTYSQFFTGTQAQTVVLPAVGTLINGYGYEINNRSTGMRYWSHCINITRYWILGNAAKRKDKDRAICIMTSESSQISQKNIFLLFDSGTKSY